MKIWNWVIGLILICAPSVLGAQEVMEAGYIVDLESDTIPGYIQEATDSRLAKKVIFKPSLQASSSKEFNPGDLLAFGFDNGRTFMQHKIYVNGSSNYVFAKRILQGKTDLFVWRTKGKAKPDLFVTNNEINKTVHLMAPAKEIITSKEGKNYSVKNKQYLELLKSIKTYEEERVQKEVKFKENKIYKDLRNYNLEFSDNYPVIEYEEKLEKRYELLFGMMPEGFSGETHFRVAAFRDKLRVERSTTWSYLRGLSYRHWENEDKVISDNYEEGFSNYRWRVLSLIPIGVKYQADKGLFRPYGYVGLGLGVVLLTDYVIENYEITGNKHSVIPFPTINAGAGLKMKLGEDFLLFEVTPSIDGIFFNLGYSI